MKPMIFLSYGMTKCGTTLAFQLLCAALERAGCVQHRLSVISQGKQINAVEHISENMARTIWSEISGLGYPVVLKTHTRPDPSVAEWLKSGKATGHAIYRDPRDMALSMMDHGARARREGQAAFSEIETLNDAMNGIANQVDSLSDWLQLPGIRPLGYDDIAFDTIATTERLLDHLAIPGDADAIVADVLANRFIQFNRGIPERYRNDMPAFEADLFRARFAPLHDCLLDTRRTYSQTDTPILAAGTRLQQDMDKPA